MDTRTTTPPERRPNLELAVKDVSFGGAVTSSLSTSSNRPSSFDDISTGLRSDDLISPPLRRRASASFSPTSPLSPINIDQIPEILSATHRHFPHEVSKWRQYFRYIVPWLDDDGELNTRRALADEKQARSLIVQMLLGHPVPSGLQGKAMHRAKRILCEAFKSGDHRIVNSLRGENAQVALDIIQEMINGLRQLEGHAGPDRSVVREARCLLNRRLQKLSCEAFEFPSSVLVVGVTRLDTKAHRNGGFADVYRGTYCGTHVAIKHLRIFRSATPSQEPAMKRHFYREAVLWFNLDHKNILKFKGIVRGLDGLSEFCMVSQWAENQDLRNYLDRLVTEGLTGSEYVRKVNKWLGDIAQGLEYLHNHELAHGDLRLVNVLVNSDETALLSDFGLSVIEVIGNSNTNPCDNSRVTKTAPEFLDSCTTPIRPTSASDMYAFGCLCVELYNNASPWGSLNEYQIISKVMHGEQPRRPMHPDRALCDTLWNFTRSCWRADPSKRPTAVDAVQVLSGLVESRPSPRP